MNFEAKVVTKPRLGPKFLISSYVTEAFELNMKIYLLLCRLMPGAAEIVNELLS